MVKTILCNLQNWMHALECLVLILLHLSLASLHHFSQLCSSSFVAPCILLSALEHQLWVAFVSEISCLLLFSPHSANIYLWKDEKVCSTQLRIFGVNFKKGLWKGGKSTIHSDYINNYETEFHRAIYVKLLPDHEPLFKGRRQKISKEAMDILD